MMESSPTTFSLNGFDLDHTSFAVRDVLSWARRFRADVGATPILGEVLRKFRYLLEKNTDLINNEPGKKNE